MAILRRYSHDQRVERGAAAANASKTRGCWREYPNRQRREPEGRAFR
jgi:hypothetical protein